MIRRMRSSTTVAALGRDGPFIAYSATFIGLSLLLDLGGVLPGVFTRLFPSWFHYVSAPLAVGTTLAYVAWKLGRPRRVDGRWRLGLGAWRSLGDAERRRVVDDPLPARALVLSLVAPVVLNTYSSWKTLIPHLNPFFLDPALASADRLIHFGVDPWRLLAPLLGHPTIIRLLDLVYWLWLPLIPFCIVWQAWSRREDLRPRFFLTFAMAWSLLGVVVATVFSSAGPCYYDRVTGVPGTFGELFAYLDLVGGERGLVARKVQEWLWYVHSVALPVPYARISAMPSMHVAIATLYAITGAATNRWLGRIFGLYAILIFLGSIQLGWHYAIDGYVSAIAVWGLWRLSGWVLRNPKRAAGERGIS